MYKSWDAELLSQAEASHCLWQLTGSENERKAQKLFNISLIAASALYSREREGKFQNHEN